MQICTEKLAGASVPTSKAEKRILTYYVRGSTICVVDAWSSLVEGDEGCIGPSDKLMCYDQTKNILQHMDGNIPCTFYCWANPGVHLLLLKSSMVDVLYDWIPPNKLVNFM